MVEDDLRKIEHRKVIGDVAEVCIGKSMHTIEMGVKYAKRKEVRKYLSQDEIGVIHISDIRKNNLINVNIQQIIYEDSRRVLAYILKDGDVIMPSKGTLLKSGVFYESDFKLPCIAENGILIIRPNQNVLNSCYLSILLNSNEGNKIIKKYRKNGVGYFSIGYKDFSNNEIPVPSIEDQNKIVRKYAEEVYGDIEKQYEDDKKQLQRLFINASKPR